VLRYFSFHYLDICSPIMVGEEGGKHPAAATCHPVLKLTLIVTTPLLAGLLRLHFSVLTIQKN
jgi:hypothetical protein